MIWAGMARKDFASKLRIANGVSNGRDGGRQIELPPIVAAHVAVLEDHGEIAKRLIGLREGPHHLLGESIRGGRVAGQGGTTNPGKQPLRLRIVPILRPSRPQGVVVELQAFRDDAAEHHRAKAAVADRQRFHPALGRPAIPEARRRVGCRVLSHGAARKRRGRGKRRDQLDEAATRKRV